MSKVAIVTDSNSGITQAQAKELGIRVMPMPFYINEEMLLEDIDLTQEQFYERLTEGADIHTSTSILTDFTELWDELLEEYDEIVHIPMSSGLSSTCSTAAMLAQDYEGKVFVVDNQRISVTQRQSVMDAMELAAAGKSGQEIYDKLMENKMESSIYIMLDTLYYLKKGGRITPAAAALGTLLKLKPVLQIQGEKLEKKLYSITPDGRAQLQEWLMKNEPLEPTPKDVFRLRMYFSDFMTPKELKTQLTLQLEKHILKKKYLTDIMHKNYHDQAPAVGTREFGDFMVLEGAIMREESYIAWLQNCLARCPEEEK